VQKAEQRQRERWDLLNAAGRQPVRMPYVDGGHAVIDTEGKHPYMSTAGKEGTCALCSGDLASLDRSVRG
jgi:hypothetical protein